MWEDGHKFTANLIWCEEKYAVTSYIAEFWNSISDVPFVGIGLYMIYSGMKIGLPGRFIFAYVALCIIGFGSFFFHATLRYEWQLMDEFPMMLLASQALFCLVANSGTPIRIKALWLTGIYSVITVVLIMYVACNIGLFFQIVFAILMTVLIAASLRVWWLAPRREQRGISIGQCMLWSFVLNLVAFILWLIDVHACPHLREARNVLGHPFIELLQLHAWWHLLTGLGLTWFISALPLADPFHGPRYFVRRRLLIFPITYRTEEPIEILVQERDK
jgi:dihydroceramidase